MTRVARTMPRCAAELFADWRIAGNAANRQHCAELAALADVAALDRRLMRA